MAQASAIPTPMTVAVIDANRRNVRDARADGLFRWVVAGAGMFVLLALAGAALSMLWGGKEAFSPSTTSSARWCRSTARWSPH